MKFGLFGSAQAKRGGSDLDSGQGFREYIDYNVEAEALGYDSIFVVEHHFTGLGQVSASLNLLTWVAARTKTLRLGTAVIVLPWHNPVLLAEQAATIDLLSGGRLEFGVGKGYRHNEFASFCIPQEEADERFEEGLALILKAWTSEERFSHHGKYWHFEDIIVEPPTAQKPHPPIWMAAGSPDSIRKVARRGYKLLLDQHASTASHHRALQHLQGRGREAAAGGSIRWMSVCRALLGGAERRGKGQGDRDAARHQQRLAKLSAARRGSRARQACCRSPRRWTPPAKARCSARRTRSREKLEALRAGRHRARAAQRPGRLARQLARPSRATSCRRLPARARRARRAAACEALVHKPDLGLAAGIPPLIKRNTLLFALSQSFIGAGTQLAYGIGPLMVIAVTGSASLAGLTVGLFGVSRFLVSYPTGKITDTFGRKPGILFGQGLTMLGSIATGFAMLAQSAVGLVAGMVLFTMGVSAAQQLRVAATDMYPPRMRGLALGFVATGSLVGIALSPLVMGLPRSCRSAPAMTAIGLPWLMLPVLIAGGMVLVKFVRPDPKEIGHESRSATTPTTCRRRNRPAGRAPSSARGSCCDSRRRGWRSSPTRPGRATWRSSWCSPRWCLRITAIR